MRGKVFYFLSPCPMLIPVWITCCLYLVYCVLPSIERVPVYVCRYICCWAVSLGHTKIFLIPLLFICSGRDRRVCWSVSHTGCARVYIPIFISHAIFIQVIYVFIADFLDHYCLSHHYYLSDACFLFSLLWICENKKQLSVISL